MFSFFVTIIHQAIGPYLKVVFFSIDGLQFQVCQAVFVVEKDYSAVITTLRDVMGIFGSYDACDSWHDLNDKAKTDPLHSDVCVLFGLKVHLNVSL